MRNLFSVSLVLLGLSGFLAGGAHADGNTYHRLMVPAGAIEGPLASDTFTQTLDHFNPADSRTFQQRYFVGSSSAMSQASPVVFFVCGEGNCQGELGGWPLELAAKMGAFVVGLEHRYYGESQPFPQLTTDTFKYLTLDQAIEDLAAFQKWMVAQGYTGKWVAIGGSYPADLAALYRLKHPELVSGAIASSACPVFTEGTDASDLVAARTAGPACTAKFRANVLMPILMAIGNRSAMAPIKAAFDASDIPDDLDFLGTVTGMAVFDIQELGAGGFCASLDSSDPFASYAEHVKTFLGYFGTRLTDWSYAGMASTDTSKYQGVIGTRQWMYQGCTQEGVFSLTVMKAHADPKESISSPLTDPLPAQYCQSYFGIAHPKSIDELNAKYYLPLLDPSTSNILFVSGSNDPACFPFSISKENGNATNPNTMAFTIQGGSHCQDLQPSTPGDSMDLQKARDLELELAKKWVGM